MASCTKKICKILRMGLEIILFCTYFVHALYTLGTRLWGYGGTCSFFSEEKKEPKKSQLAVLPHGYLNSNVFRELYTGSYPAFLRRLARPEPAAFALSEFAAHASYNLT